MNKNKILGYALGPIGSALLGFISLPIITWFYSIEDVGKISMLQVVASLTVLLFCLGLDQAYVREYHESKDKPKLFKTSFLPGFILLVLAFSGLYVADDMLVSRLLYGQESRYLTIISFICFILTFFSRFLSLILRMQERAFAYSISQLLPKLFFLIFILITVWLGFTKDFYNLITAHALSILIVFVVFAWNTRNDWIKSITKPINRNELQKQLDFGLPLVIGGLAAWGLNVMDKVLLRNLSTFSELGIYSVTSSVAGVATIFAGIFNLIWAPMVYKWVSECSDDINNIGDIAEHLLAAVYFLIVLTGLFSWVLPFFLPDEYAAIQYLIIPCLMAPLFYTLSEVSSVGILIVRKSSLSMIASIVAMLVNGAGNYILIPKYGAGGAAISTAFSFWMFLIVRTEFSKRSWRYFSSTKLYIVISMLLFSSILNVMFLNDVKSSTVFWGAGLLIGCAIFHESLTLLYKKVAKQEQ